MGTPFCVISEKSEYTVSRYKVPKGDGHMKLDRNAVSRLLSLDDEKFRKVISALAAESGLGIGTPNLSDADVASLRNALSIATDSDIEKAAGLLKKKKSGD